MARLLLGALCNKPQALNSDKYSLTADDFPLDFHRILFQIISYLAKHGSECINAVDIQALVEKHMESCSCIYFELLSHLQIELQLRELCDEKIPQHVDW